MSDIVKKGQPDGLYVLFFSEMWERFCYYGMRVLLILYLTKSLLNGDADAALIYGAYTGLVYAAPILGGRLADKFLGYRLAVIVGAVMMSIGEFLILGGGEQMLMVGMGVLIIGNGYFKANISTIVGKLYKDDPAQRDAGFTIFYIGINIGAFLATTVVAYIGETYGFQYGFALAGGGMLLGGSIFYLGRQRYSAAEGLNITEEGRKPAFLGLNKVTVVIIGTFFLIPACYVLIQQNEVLEWLLLGLFVFIAIMLVRAGITADQKEGAGNSVWQNRMIALVIFMVINIVFWACFEQAGTSLTLFADRNVDRIIMGWEMPASMTQMFNPLFIVIFGSIFSVMWIRLSKIGRNPSIPMKFALGIFQLGIGFLVTMIGLQFVNEAYQVPLLILVFLYMFHTSGELFLSPIGLSMVTKLAPKAIAGFAMGAWFLSFAMANFAGGKIATLTAGHTEDGITLTLAEGLEKYTSVFSNLGFILLGIAVLLALLSKPLNKLMHGVK
ncbi:MAG: peptide MFS transporter [Bacteroidetes bacterium]|nr:peptide MFS transporter [Bacteroidota bacterium]